MNGLRKTEVYSYAQDEWKFRPNLTLNLGVRYSFYNIFHEVHGKANPFDFATCGAAGYCGVGASFGNPNTLDVDPRISLAWSPSALGGGKTVIRSGFGIYHGDGQLDDQNVPIKNEVGAYSLSAQSTPGLSYPITPFLNGPGTISANADYRGRKDMYVSQWGLSVQRALPHDLVGTLSYVGSKGTYELITSYVNLINPATGLRPYPAFGQVRWRGNSNSSSYDGLVASLQRSFSHGLLISANYAYTHQIDQDAPGGGDSDNPQNPACMSCERASGDFDARHVLNANVIYDLPFGPGKAFLSQPGIARAVLGRWSLTDIVAARTGTPLNITYSRPSSSIATGYTTNAAPESGSRSFAHSTRRKVDPWNIRELDQPKCFHRGNRSGQLRRHPAQHRSRPRPVADRPRCLQAHSHRRARPAPIQVRGIQPLQSCPVQPAAGTNLVARDRDSPSEH